MENKTKTRTEQILTVITILAWIAFIGFMIEAGAILVSFGVSCINPDAAKDLYKGLNLYDLRQLNFWYYAQHVSLMAVFPILKTYVMFMLIKIVSKINLANPFTMEVANRLEKISYALFAGWLFALISSAHSGWLSEISGKQFGNEVPRGLHIYSWPCVYYFTNIQTGRRDPIRKRTNCLRHADNCKSGCNDGQAKDVAERTFREGGYNAC